MKTCNKCGNKKSLDDFHKCSRNKDGKDNICIECINRNKHIRYNKNKETYTEYKRNYWKEHKEERKILSHNWYEKNKKQILTKWKEQRDKNPEIHRKQNSKYYNENRDKVMFRNNKNTKIRIKNDPMFRVTKNLRGRMNSVLKGNIKSVSTLELLGCSIEYYKQYIEKQFINDMTWENYGEYWHIDHIKPCSKFNLLLEDEQRKCFHYTNTQPLLARDNLKKYNKYM